MTCAFSVCVSLFIYSCKLCVHESDVLFRSYSSLLNSPWTITLVVDQSDAFHFLRHKRHFAISTDAHIATVKFKISVKSCINTHNKLRFRYIVKKGSCAQKSKYIKPEIFMASILLNIDCQRLSSSNYRWNIRTKKTKFVCWPILEDLHEIVFFHEFIDLQWALCAASNLCSCWPWSSTCVIYQLSNLPTFIVQIIFLN